MDISAFVGALGAAADEFTLLFDEPMSRHTSFHIGGSADVLALPHTERAVAAALAAAKGTGTPRTILGNGSNVLVSDEGLRGAVLCFGREFSAVAVNGTRITAQAGALLSAIAGAALKVGLTGLEFASGIPGSLGGALYMDAGAYGGQMADVVRTTRYLDGNGDIHTVQGAEHAFGYRTSVFKQHPDWVILSCEMELQPGDPAEIKAKMDDFNGRRRDKQPLNYPSAGSTFKRPQGYFAGKLIQDAGLMGYTVGGAQVSTKHAGFVVNVGEATCADVKAVISHVQREVQRQFGVELEPEVLMLG